MNAAPGRRSVAPEPVDRATPPPLQQPDQHGRRQDPAAEAWLPESTLDPATRAWLTGADRQQAGPTAPVPVRTPDAYAPRSAPTHVHGAGSGLGAWTGGEGSPSTQAPTEPPLDPDAFPSEPVAVEDDPEVTRVAPRSGAGTTPVPPTFQPSQPVAETAAAPFWAPEPAPATAPSAPSWWIGRAVDEQSAAAEPVTESVSADRDDAVSPAEPTAAPVQDEATPDALPEGDTAARPGDTAVVEPLVDRRSMRPTPLVQPGLQPTTCHVCGHRLEPDDIFCGECGAVRPAVTAAFTGPVMPLPMDRPDWAANDDGSPVEAPDDEIPVDAPTDDAERTDDPEPTDEVGPTDDVEPTDDAKPTDQVEATDDVEVSRQDVPAREDASVPTAAPLPPVPTVAPLPPIPGVEPARPLSDADAVPSSSDADESAQLDEDVDETRIVTKTPTRAPFVLHFSTGERIGVHGTGLLGRLPRPEPGERFDDLLTIHDPGKSVSKTHLELGRDDADLWVSDRFSGNGSVIRHIDGSIRRCEPGRRYRVERGARVDIGEQFFLVQ
ncbi:hypothetical protein [Curtobacterium sp. Curtsp57]|uniref:hypothetical protein n=1 Tax=Curtobacterium sp. Curtsp57 TaxID=3243047 RepID=UPI0039B3C7D4